jgi:hypothetical protein
MREQTSPSHLDPWILPIAASLFRILRKVHMNANIPLILTTAVSISTIIYTFYSIQLWRMTRVATEISRQATFSNLWAELNRYIELLRRENAPEAGLLQKLSSLLLELMITNLIAHAASKESQSGAEFRRRISALIAENQADVAKVPWITKLAEYR